MRDIGNYQSQIALFIDELCRIYYRHSQPEDRQDITIEVALIAHQRCGEMDEKPETQFRAWLHEIAKNVVRNWSRREAKSARNLVGSLDDEHLPNNRELPSEPHRPETDLFLREELAAVRNAVSELRPMHQQVIALFYVQELTEREIAKRLGIRPGTVKSRLHSARKQLKIRLKRYFE